MLRKLLPPEITIAHFNPINFSHTIYLSNQTETNEIKQAYLAKESGLRFSSEKLRLSPLVELLSRP